MRHQLIRLKSLMSRYILQTVTCKWHSNSWHNRSRWYRYWNYSSRRCNNNYDKYYNNSHKQGYRNTRLGWWRRRNGWRWCRWWRWRLIENKVSAEMIMIIITEKQYKFYVLGIELNLWVLQSFAADNQNNHLWVKNATGWHLFFPASLTWSWSVDWFKSYFGPFWYIQSNVCSFLEKLLLLSKARRKCQYLFETMHCYFRNVVTSQSRSSTAFAILAIFMKSRSFS
jgi:hypothetical protein